MFLVAILSITALTVCLLRMLAKKIRKKQSTDTAIGRLVKYLVRRGREGGREGEVELCLLRMLAKKIRKKQSNDTAIGRLVKYLVRRGREGGREGEVELSACSGCWPRRSGRSRAPTRPLAAWSSTW